MARTELCFVRDIYSFDEEQKKHAKGEKIFKLQKHTDTLSSTWTNRHKNV